MIDVQIQSAINTFTYDVLPTGKRPEYVGISLVYNDGWWDASFIGYWSDGSSTDYGSELTECYPGKTGFLASKRTVAAAVKQLMEWCNTILEERAERASAARARELEAYNSCAL